MNGIFFVLSAFALGALHALEPGHGKTVVAAYLVGSKGRVRDAITLGGIVTFTHTFSIIVLGLLTAVAAAYLVPETVHEVLEVVSGLLIVGVGLWMVNDRILKRNTGHGHSHGDEPGHSRGHHGHEHAHGQHDDHHDRFGHGHESPHEDGPAHDHHDHDHNHGEAEPSHAHPQVVAASSGSGWRQTTHHHHHGQFSHAHEHASGHHEGEAHEHAALVLIGAGTSHQHGAVAHVHPLPQGETHHHHPELERGSAESLDRDEDHSHTQGDAPHGLSPDHLHEHDHPHEHPHAEAHDHPHGQAHDHDHEHDHHGHDRGPTHSHGGHTHSHTLPPGEKPSLGTLITLGVSGGIVPCPAALALLLAAVAAGNILGGVSLVIVFSLGLAAVLIALGIAMVKAASLAGRYLSGDLTDRISKRAGAVSAVVVTLLGLAMTARAIIDVTGARLF